MKDIMTLLLLIALSGCSGNTTDKQTKQQAITQVSAPFAEGGIILNIVAEPGLNSWNEVANSCTLLIIQAQKSGSLNKILSNPAQLKNLFNGAGAQDEILKIDRYSAMPGQKITLHIDRIENTRHIAIVAGYYPFPKKQHMVIASVPVTMASEGWWTKGWSAELATLTLSITLGSQSIAQLKSAESGTLALEQTESITLSNNVLEQEDK